METLPDGPESAKADPAYPAVIATTRTTIVTPRNAGDARAAPDKQTRRRTDRRRQLRITPHPPFRLCLATRETHGISTRCRQRRVSGRIFEPVRAVWRRSRRPTRLLALRASKLPRRVSADWAGAHSRTQTTGQLLPRLPRRGGFRVEEERSGSVVPSTKGLHARRPLERVRYR